MAYIRGGGGTEVREGYGHPAADGLTAVHLSAAAHPELLSATYRLRVYRTTSGYFAYKAPNNKDTLHIKH